MELHTKIIKPLSKEKFTMKSGKSNSKINLKTFSVKTILQNKYFHCKILFYSVPFLNTCFTQYLNMTHTRFHCTFIYLAFRYLVPSINSLLFFDSWNRHDISASIIYKPFKYLITKTLKASVLFLLIAVPRARLLFLSSSTIPDHREIRPLILNLRSSWDYVGSFRFVYGTAYAYIREYTHIVDARGYAQSYKGSTLKDPFVSSREPQAQKLAKRRTSRRKSWYPRWLVKNTCICILYGYSIARKKFSVRENLWATAATARRLLLSREH